MNSGLLWQLAQSWGIAVRFGLPMNPFAFDMAMEGSSLVGSPPWQFAQPKPFWRWMSFLMSNAGFWRSPSIEPWQSRHVSLGGICATKAGIKKIANRRDLI